MSPLRIDRDRRCVRKKLTVTDVAAIRQAARFRGEDAVRTPLRVVPRLLQLSFFFGVLANGLLGELAVVVGQGLSRRVVGAGGATGVRGK